MNLEGILNGAGPLVMVSAPFMLAGILRRPAVLLALGTIVLLIALLWASFPGVGNP